MNWHRIRTIIGKEWIETLHNRQIVWTFLIMLLIFTLLPLMLAFVLPAYTGELTLDEREIELVRRMLGSNRPEILQLDSQAQFQIIMLRQFIILFLMLPVMGAMSIATYSIIGEKTSRSLEALLATPIRTDELLLAKSVGAALPGVLATWLAFALFALIVRLAGGAEVARYVLDSAAWAVILLITPLIALLGLGAGVLVSSRVNDPRSAQQVAGLIVLPLILLFVGQASGVLLLGLPLVLAGALILTLIDVAILLAGIHLFDRETILTKWR